MYVAKICLSNTFSLNLKMLHKGRFNFNLTLIILQGRRLYKIIL